ncbi:hypothetical protein B0H16DRAFT_1752747 [Mycena metata]|uniref:Uncharacterized protein n=1 Tax=Mycena metata TaxID=1033252 RepID=A0AAD7DF76_9AGAR|nr:hypothetical protein B0H16DRAFT_1752747 [Mycena metata]
MSTSTSTPANSLSSPSKAVQPSIKVVSGWQAFETHGDRMAKDGILTFPFVVPAYIPTFLSCLQPANIPVFKPTRHELPSKLATMSAEDASSVYFLNCAPIVRLLPVLRYSRRLSRVDALWVEKLIDKSIPFLRHFSSTFHLFKDTVVRRSLLAALYCAMQVCPPSRLVNWVTAFPCPVEDFESAPALKPNFRFEPWQEFKPTDDVEPYLLTRESFAYFKTVPGEPIRELVGYMANLSQPIPPHKFAKTLSASIAALTMLRYVPGPPSTRGLVETIFETIQYIIPRLPEDVRDPSWASNLPTINRPVVVSVPSGFFLPGPADEYDTVYPLTPYPTRKALSFPDELMSSWKAAYPDVWPQVEATRPPLSPPKSAAPVVSISKTLPPSRTPTPAPSSIIKVKSKGREVQQLKDAEDASKTKSKSTASPTSSSTRSLPGRSTRNQEPRYRDTARRGKGAAPSFALCSPLAPLRKLSKASVALLASGRPILNLFSSARSESAPFEPDEQDIDEVDSEPELDKPVKTGTKRSAPSSGSRPPPLKRPYRGPGAKSRQENEGFVPPEQYPEFNGPGLQRAFDRTTETIAAGVARCAGCMSAECPCEPTGFALRCNRCKEKSRDYCDHTFTVERHFEFQNLLSTKSTVSNITFNMLLSQVLRDQDAVLDARKLQAAAFSRYTESTQMLTAQLQAMIGFYGREGLPHVLHVPEEAREAFVDYWEQAIEAFEAPSKDYPALAADALQRYTMFPISDEDKVIWAQLTAV